MSSALGGRQQDWVATINEPMTADQSGKHHPSHPPRPSRRRHAAALFLAALGLALISSPSIDELDSGEMVEAIIGNFGTTIPDRTAGFAPFLGAAANRLAEPDKCLN